MLRENVPSHTNEPLIRKQFLQSVRAAVYYPGHSSDTNLSTGQRLLSRPMRQMPHMKALYIRNEWCRFIEHSE